jgi:hypothetical protein
MSGKERNGGRAVKCSMIYIHNKKICGRIWCLNFQLL